MKDIENKPHEFSSANIRMIEAVYRKLDSLFSCNYCVKL